MSIEAYFVDGTGDFFDELFVICTYVYFNEIRSCWVCEGVSSTSDPFKAPSVLYLPSTFCLRSVSS